MNGHRNVLLTGGAGYIGAHTVLALGAAGYHVVVLDDLSTGQRESVPDIVPFIEGNIGDPTRLASVLKDHAIGTVMHFAGSIVVPESVEKPLAYYRNNTVNSHTLIETCVRAGVDRFVFSSTAAVYGAPHRVPIDEDAPTVPINPYGRSKLMTEWMLRDAAAAHGLRFVALRYFNVAGADPANRVGQCSEVATHLIKIACEAVVGRRKDVLLFGNDYPTPDGTCIRDYVHVSDLAAAHVAAARYLEEGGESEVFNCGYGHGYSVREVLDAMERVAGAPLPVRIADRRAGDPPELIAAIGRIRDKLHWEPRYDDLDVIVSTALAWERKLMAMALGV